MQFCCDLKASNKVIKAILIKLTALSLMLALFGNLAAQTFHQHSDTKSTYKSNTLIQLKVTEHCKVCDHFQHHNSAGIAPDVVCSTLANRLAAIEHSYTYQQYSNACSLDAYVNKGPPAI